MTYSDPNPTPATVSPTSPTPLHYHLIGIGGIGISAFARLLRAGGHTVSGCDVALSDLTEQLEAEGIPVSLGHSAEHVTHNPLGRVDVVVASEAIPKMHPELLAAQAQGIRIVPRMALLDELLRASPSIGVIGTHGKTTTTSMIAVALLGAGLDPSAFVGGKVPEFDGSNARLGTGPLVAEVDESDKNFAALHCETAVFTNAEDDHVGGKLATYWETVEEQHAAFARFVGQAGRVLYCADWQGKDGEGLKPLLTQAKETLSYGTAEGCDYRAENVRPDTEGTSFTVTYKGQMLGEARVALPGTHNTTNALAALAIVHLYGGDFARAASALADFAGPGRRWEKVGTLNGAQVIDDYAHNPTKVAAALQAGHQTGRRVRVVFQPHRYLRTQQSWPELSQSLMAADEVLLLDIAAASEEPIEGIHATLIRDRLQELGHPHITYYPDRAEAVKVLRDTASEGDLIITMGAGDVWKISRELVGRA